MANGIEIGVQLYTLRKLCKTPEGVAEVMRRVASLGAKNVQLSSICEMPAEQLRKIADENSLTICGTHSPFDRFVNDIDRLAEEHNIMGATVAGLGMMPQRFTKNEDSLKEFIELANGFCEKLKPYGVRFGYHNHFMEFKKINGKTKLDIMIEQCPDMQFILDTYWVKFSGFEPLDYINKLSGRLDLLHLKDYKKSLFVKKICDVGSGTLDFASILSAADNAGTKWAVIEHDFTSEPYRTVENGIKHFNSVYRG